MDEAAIKAIVARYHQMWEELDEVNETGSSTDWDSLKGNLEQEAFDLLGTLAAAVTPPVPAAT